MIGKVLDSIGLLGEWVYPILFFAVFLGRFVGLLRAVVPFSAGLSRMHYGKFLVYNASGGVVWAAGFASLGYLFGRNWQLFERWAEPAGMVVAGVAAAVFVVIFLRKRNRKR